ncbi:MAG: hypothetical protein ACREB9_00650 [Thermoplasmata archaeon]
MSDSREQSQLREHLGLIKQAVKGIGHDFSVEIQQLDKRIGRLSDATGQEAERAGADIRHDLGRLKANVEHEVRSLPGVFTDAGEAIGHSTRQVASYTRDAMVSAGHSAKEGTKDILARAGGVKKRPIREWSPPPAENDPERKN